jgi:Uncharacterized protein conserved in bacteria (DUF2325)
MDIAVMSSRTSDMLSSIFSTGRPPAAPAFARGMIPMKVRAPGEAPAGEFMPPVAKRRTAIYDMHHSVHCSIIGTCLSAGELQRLLINKPQEINPEGIAATMPELDGTLVLYVGGRAHQVPALKAVVERAGGLFLYHDGGIEHAAALLPGLVSRADCAAFPIDCVSHDAMTTVKRLCRQAAKPLIPLRTSSLASLLSGLSALKGASRAPPAAD